jgi:hypothetical protein
LDWEVDGEDEHGDIKLERFSARAAVIGVSRIEEEVSLQEGPLTLSAVGRWRSSLRRVTAEPPRLVSR